MFEREMKKVCAYCHKRQAQTNSEFTYTRQARYQGQIYKKEQYVRFPSCFPCAIRLEKFDRLFGRLITWGAGAYIFVCILGIFITNVLNFQGNTVIDVIFAIMFTGFGIGLVGAIVWSLGIARCRRRVSNWYKRYHAREWEKLFGSEFF